MKRPMVFAIVVMIFTAMVFYPAPAVYAEEELDEVFDGFREAMEEYADAIAKGKWQDIEKGAKKIQKRAGEIVGLEEGKRNGLFKFEADWLVRQADEIVTRAREKDMAESVWDYGALYTRYQGVLSTVPHWAVDEFSEGIEELREAAKEKDKDDAAEAAERIDEGGMQLVQAANFRSDAFANTRWVSSIQKLVPTEHDVVDAMNKGDWDEVDKIVAKAEKMHKKVKFSMKK